ncbi:MAG: hypothetical protein PHY73_02080 [Candidatus Omnitrophica bacterium]|nr:hypothetical protein [Candidatus Omnitrophota bacterium]
MNKIEKMQDVWSEVELCEKMGLPLKKEKSRVVGNWVTLGLKCFEVGDRRFFVEEDLVKFLNNQYNLSN